MPERTLDNAKEVIAKAIEFGAFAWDNPDDSEDDKKVMETVSGLIDLAQQASAKGRIHDAILEILHAAQVEPLSDTTREAYTARFKVAPASSNGHAPDPATQPVADHTSDFGGTVNEPKENFAPLSREDVSAMARAAAAPTESQSSASSEPAHSPAPAAEEIDITAIFGPGYDDLKVADIKKAVLASAASGDLSPEEWEQIKAYESAHEERKTILSLQPEFKAPEPEPVPEPTGAFIGSATKGVTTPEMVAGAAKVMLQPDDGDSIGAFYHGESISRAQQEGLPLPKIADLAQAPVVPINIVDLSDKDLSALGAQLHSCFAYGQWLLSQEENRANAAEHLEREAERDAFVRAYELHKQSIPEEKRTQPTSLEAARKQAEHDAKSSDSVVTWRSKKVRHEIDAREIKALVNGWDKGVWRVDKELDRRSRLATTGRAAS